MASTILGKCPLCRKMALEKTKPFCSSRCAMLDLGQWLGEGYVIPVAADNSEDMDALPRHSEDEE